MKLTLLCLLFFSVTAYSQTVPAYVDTTGLTEWFPFTGNANDSSGYGNNATVYGATLTADRFGHANSAYKFDGNSSYISTNGSFSFDTTEKSYSVWFKQDTVKRGWIISGGYDFSGYAFGLFVQDGAGEILFYGDDLPYDQPIDTLTDTTWHHMVVTYANDTIKSYVDGVLKNSGYDLLTTTYGPTVFGRRQDPTLESGNDAYFQGKIDDIGMWKRALSQCEVSKLYYSINSLIVHSPVNDTVADGGQAVFTISDTGGAATYQWQENNGSGFVNLVDVGLYAGATTKTLTIIPVNVAMNNYQYRCLRSGGECLDTSNSANLRVNSAEGISTNETESSFIIAPNPVKNILQINSQIIIKNIVIYNMIGQILFLQKCNCNSEKIDVTFLNQGIYILKINYILKIIIKQ